MIALATPSPVYWLLDVVQLIGGLGILGGLWFLATKADSRAEEYRIRRQMRKPVVTSAAPAASRPSPPGPHSSALPRWPGPSSATACGR